MVKAAALAWSLSVAAALATQIPVEKEPHHRVVFEDAQLRVLDVNVPPRELTLEHRHDHDIATVSISAADTRTISPGQPWGPTRPRRPPGAPNTTEYTGKPGVHTIENVGQTLYRLIAVENLRDGNWSTGALLDASATSLAIESRAFRVYDVRLGAAAPLTRHIHQVPAVAVLVAGAIVADTESAPQRLDQPGQWVLVKPRELHRMVVSGSDAHIVEIEVR